MVGSFSTLRSLSCQSSLTWIRSYISSKEDAFSAPEALAPSIASGNISITQLEAALAEAYVTLNRPDLAQMVYSGKKYQLLERATRGDVQRGQELAAMRVAFKSIPSEKLVEPVEVITTANWIKAARERYRGDPGLESLMEECQQQLPTLMRDKDWYGFSDSDTF